MKHLNNHFQKGVIVFVILMVSIIPNMKIYSFIGSYKMSSMAITVNNTHKYSSLTKEKPFVSLIETVILEVAFWALVASIIGGAVTAIVLGVQKGSIANNNIDANYVKYDFSKFDN